MRSDVRRRTPRRAEPLEREPAGKPPTVAHLPAREFRAERDRDPACSEAQQRDTDCAEHQQWVDRV